MMERDNTRPAGRVSPERGAAASPCERQHVAERGKHNAPKPAVILINPQMGENIGAVARAMMNFGLRELRIVNPRDGWPNPAALSLAAHGVEIIEHARLYASTREAVADLQYLYASTARDRRLNKPLLDPREAMVEAAGRCAAGQKTGIVFGPERTGLENEDIALAQAIVTVPTDPDHASLNLAQCAVVVGYEWWMAQGVKHTPQNFEKWQGTPAAQEDVNLFFDHLEAALDETYFFKRDEKKPRMWRNLRATFQKAELSAQEVNSLRGVISALQKGRKTRDSLS